MLLKRRLAESAAFEKSLCGLMIADRLISRHLMYDLKKF